MYGRRTIPLYEYSKSTTLKDALHQTREQISKEIDEAFPDGATTLVGLNIGGGAGGSIFGDNKSVEGGLAVGRDEQGHTSIRPYLTTTVEDLSKNSNNMSVGGSIYAGINATVIPGSYRNARGKAEEHGIMTPWGSGATITLPNGEKGLSLGVGPSIGGQAYTQETNTRIPDWSLFTFSNEAQTKEGKNDK